MSLVGPGLELGHEIMEESVGGVVKPETGATEGLYTQTLGCRSNTCKMNRNSILRYLRLEGF